MHAYILAYKRAQTLHIYRPNPPILPFSSEYLALGALLKGLCYEKRFINDQIQYNTRQYNMCKAIYLSLDLFISVFVSVSQSICPSFSLTASHHPYIHTSDKNLRTYNFT